MIPLPWWRKRASDYFQQAVRQHFGFVERLGYGLPEFPTDCEQSLGWVYSAKYYRTERMVSIEVTDSWRLGNVLTVFVFRTPRQTIYEDDMDMDLFAAKHAPDIRAALSKANDAGRKSMKSVIATEFPLYAALLSGPARTVLTGEAWETGLYAQWT